jgi:hypothetical protein
MNNNELKIIPYTATSLSIIGRFIFMFLLYNKKAQIIYLYYFVFVIFFHLVCGYIIASK